MIKFVSFNVLLYLFEFMQDICIYNWLSTLYIDIMKRTSKRNQKPLDRPQIPDLNNMITLQEQQMIDADYT